MIALIGCLVGCLIGPILIRSLADRARNKRLNTYLDRRAPELRSEYESVRRLLTAHDADQQRGGVYRIRGTEPDDPPAPTHDVPEASDDLVEIQRRR